MNKKLSSVSFFCPAYHDEKNLPELIPAVHNFLSEVSDIFEITIIEDGSPDDTGKVADSLAEKYSNVRVIHHKKNLGYGATLKEGWKQGKYDYVMYTDGDNQYDIKEFGPYLHLLENNDVLSGYAVKKAVSLKRKFQSFVFNLLIRILFFYNAKDIDCSMKVFKKSVLDRMSIESDSAFIDAEMILKAKRMGYKIADFPVTHYERLSGIASGSKLKIIIPTIVDMLKFRLGMLD